MALTQFFRKVLKQWAVYWPPAGTDSHSKVVYGDPIEIRCRWQDSTQLFLDKGGQQQVSHSQVFFGGVSAAGDPLELLEQGVLWLSPNLGNTTNPLDTLDDDHKKNPFKNTRAWTIRRVDVDPDIKPTSALRTIYL